MLRECLLPFSFSCLLFPVTWELSFRLISFYEKYSGLPRWLSGKKSACQYRSHRRCGLDPWVRKIPRRRKWQPTPVFLLGESQGQRSLASYSPQGCNEQDMTEWSHVHTCLKSTLGYFPGGQWLRLQFPMWGTWVQFLVRDLRSHMPQGVAKNLKMNKTIKKKKMNAFLKDKREVLHFTGAITKEKWRIRTEETVIKLPRDILALYYSFLQLSF